jgi:hypothetical protein
MNGHEYKESLLAKAHAEFLYWTFRNDTIRKEYVDFIIEANAQEATEDAKMTFDEWATWWYWGDEK